MASLNTPMPYHPDALTAGEEADLPGCVDTLDFGPVACLGNPSLRNVPNFDFD